MYRYVFTSCCDRNSKYLHVFWLNMMRLVGQYMLFQVITQSILTYVNELESICLGQNFSLLWSWTETVFILCRRQTSVKLYMRWSQFYYWLKQMLEWLRSGLCGSRKYPYQEWLLVFGLHSPSPPLHGISSFTSYFPLKTLTTETPTPSDFPMTILVMDKDIFWTCTFCLTLNILNQMTKPT